MSGLEGFLENPEVFPVRNWKPPEKFLSDPVAQLCQWTPCDSSRDKSDYELRELIVHGAERLEFRSTRKQLLIQGCVVLPFLAVLCCLSLGAAVSSVSGPSDALGLQILFGLLSVPCSLMSLSLVGIFLLRMLPTMVQPIVFDREHGFSMGRGCATSPPALLPKDVTDRLKPLNEEIHAVQVLEAMGACQLNVVLMTGDRIGIVNHSQADVVRRYAARLAEFLGVEVWDDSSRGVWEFSTELESNVWSFGKMIWLGVTKQREKLGCWVWKSSFADDDQTWAG